MKLIADGRLVHFAKLVYTVFHVQGNHALSGLGLEGCPPFRGFNIH